MSVRVRTWIAVGAAAAASAALAVGIAYATGGRSGAPPESRGGTAKRIGPPPLLLSPGLGSDAETRAMRRALTLYAGGEHERAGRIFRRYRSVGARIGAAFAAWQGATVQELRRIVRGHPRSGEAWLHLGLALAWSGEERPAQAAWRQAERVDPDSPAAVQAGTALHPEMAPGLPGFIPGFAAPAEVERLPAARQLEVLARAARRSDLRAKLLYGVALQRVGRPRSAARQFAAAAALQPDSVEARVADAVGRFDKDEPSRAFARLGPLVRVYPREPTVRFHLGWLLLWIGNDEQGRHELRLARAAGPSTPLGREANRVLARLESSRTRRRER